MTFSIERTDQPSARTVLVTGGSRGIGAAITRQLLARERNVACGYRTGREAAEKLQADAPDLLLPVSYDSTVPTSASAAVQTVLAHWGRLDALVLNAGHWDGGRLATMHPDRWWRVIEVNLRGVAELTRSALPALVSSPDPSIVIVSSVVGLIGHAGDTAYASAKAAMVGFARSLAKEMARERVRVNVLAPGFVETDMTAAISERARLGIADSALLGRFGGVEEIARAAVFLSEDATYCTGSVLTADGGWSI